jgi:hypothetical protein
MADDLLGQARRLAELLSSRGIAHAFIAQAFIDCVAMNAWSIPVPTYDIDLCADVAPEDVPDLIAELDRAGFVPPATAWIESIGSARFQEFTVHWPFQDNLRAADIFLATDPFQKSALSRRRGVELDEGFRTDVVSPEDPLLYKLIAYRNKDRAAIERLLAIQSSMDWSYLRGWAHRLGVTARLEEALRDAGLGSRLISSGQ